ncbi:hypothetical protein [Moellerella wisconsensis]|uniref:Uncharacterized protein n=1 Tax=Moellerella wisconsensis TaxID=158849 RepID=A0A9Q8Q368_9GAMM|nr:hypothetical protein [Moellerella wisconsensis]UNH31156.1 hypothetical protein MNY72_02165 [Moellerella wisconsensis]
MKKKKVKLNPIATITGVVTKCPQRVATTTNKVMVSMMVEVQSDKRSNYPMRVTGFDERALSLMLCRKGQIVTITGRSSYWHGYQLVMQDISLP